MRSNQIGGLLINTNSPQRNQCRTVNAFDLKHQALQQWLYEMMQLPWQSDAKFAIYFFCKLELNKTLLNGAHDIGLILRLLTHKTRYRNVLNTQTHARYVLDQEKQNVHWLNEVTTSSCCPTLIVSEDGSCLYCQAVQH